MVHALEKQNFWLLNYLQYYSLFSRNLSLPKLGPIVKSGFSGIVMNNFYCILVEKYSAETKTYEDGASGSFVKAMPE